MNEYQEFICGLAGITFEKITDSDLISFTHIDQGFGIKSCVSLWKANGRLKDVQFGKQLPKVVRPQGRPFKMIKKEENDSELILEKSFAEPIQQTIKTEIIPLKTNVEDKFDIVAWIAQQTQPSKKYGKKYNISDDQRQMKSKRMKETMRKYWENKKKAIME